MRGRVIAIDGPAGSGKSTLARGLALELGLAYVNTGLMYRALTRLALDRGTDADDGPALARLMNELRFALSQGEPPSLIVNGAAPGEELSSAEVEASVSAVARHPEVRERMREAQRRLGANGAVMEGRDIGSVIFPDADAKIFLLARPDERAARRVEERGGPEEVSSDLAEALARRDALDARVNPFVPAPDAHHLDTSGRTREETLAEALRLIRARLPEEVR